MHQHILDITPDSIVNMY